MRAYHMLLLDAASSEPRRVDFTAASPDQAFQVARNEQNEIHVELWEADRLLARMSKSQANLWKLLPTGVGNDIGLSPPAAERLPGIDEGAAANGARVATHFPHPAASPG